MLSLASCGTTRPSRVLRQDLRAEGGNSGRRRKQKAQQPGLFEVQLVSPPPTSLGIHELPPTTHNGDQIEVDGKDYIVSSVVLKYKLVKGKYQRDHNRLEVQRFGRYLTNLYLEQLMHK